MIPSIGAPMREASAGYLTLRRPLLRIDEPVPSHATWVAALVTAGIVIMLCAVIAAAVSRDLGPDPDPRNPMLRAMLAFGLAVLGAAAGVSLGAGG